MKKLGALFLILNIFLVSCSHQNPEEQKKYLNGYWEIEKVTVSPDSTITYKVNQNIDYIELKGDKGTRTKVRPQLDGGFKSSKVSEKLTLKIENDSLRLYYKTPYDSWKETVLNASKESFSIRAKNGNIYYYKKFKPLIIEKNEAE
ncbi:lipocalin family protein [Zunongwangia sp.]|uniref:lipocalin family protein n=1 Tax=Zunongwangia sp. TaxID=1965325 RepID=UPI003AA9D8AA